MKILIVGLVKNEQLQRVKEEGENRGHVVDGCYTSDLIINAGRDDFKPKLKSGNDIEKYDLIYLWTVGKRRWEWYTAVLHLREKFGTVIVNEKVVDPGYNFYLTPAIDYLLQVKNDLPFPRSSIVFSAKSVDLVANDYEFPVIVKTSSGRQGRGVFKFESVDELKEKINELKDKDVSFVIREFIPNDGDVRVFTVGYKAIGAMKRTPTREGEFRSNISQGGKGEKFDLTVNPKVRELAEKTSKVLRTEIAGVDIMLHAETGDPYILEINPGPQFMGLEKFTGVNAALSMIEYFERLSHE